MSDIKETPLMKQYNELKGKYPNTIMLFRVGDFYETFGEDAIKTSKILGIVLTRRANGAATFVELSGFPYHSLDTYLPKLVQAGFRVAICEQLEEASKDKKIVKRGVTDIITPGLTTNDKILESNKNNFLASIHFGDKENGVSLIDISTGEFYTFQGRIDKIKKIIDSHQPKEIIFEKKYKTLFEENFSKQYNFYLLDDWVFKLDFSKRKLLEFFKTSSLKGFGLEQKQEAIISAGAILQYLEDTHNENTHISKISIIDDDKYVWVDHFTAKNLDLYSSQNRGSLTLIDILDKTLCPMGGRMMKRWIALPLKNIDEINERQDNVSILFQGKKILEDLRENLTCIGDLERWTSRISNAKISPKEINLLKESLIYSNKLKILLENIGNPILNKLAEKLNESSEIEKIIDETLDKDAPSLISKGNVIKENFNSDLDYFRNLLFNSKDLLDKMLEKEIENTKISSLKIGFNNIFGYYFEVTNIHKDKVPQDWQRKQTLTTAERYINEELKKFEEEILSAQDKIQSLESRLYYELIDILKTFINKIQENGNILGEIDCLCSFAFVAIENNYTCPEILENDTIEILQGRHPIIEKCLPLDTEYIPNDIFLDKKNEQILIITGPNMAGKSAFLRQNAIITLMSQMGSFVPCKSAKIGIVDKVFSRVGASDNISSGESTFMVEMNETANILNNLTSKSLIILDEIGRGTSTYDGISIAWAITEYLHECKEKPKTIFATHYHELNEMEKQFEQIKNYSIGIKEIDNKIFFTRKLHKGGSQHSFGIHVAQMAGIPNSVTTRAYEILKTLENTKTKNIEIQKYQKDINLNIFEVEDHNLLEIKTILEKINLDNLTPLEALMKLNELINRIK